MSQLIQARRDLRKRIRERVKIDRYFHLYTTFLLLGNMVLILYALISVTGRMTLSGVGLIDSLPIGLYILPLLVFLPIMIRAFYRERTAAWNFVFMTICTVFFSLLSLLVRGFIIFLVLNIVGQALLFIMGRFRPKGSLRKASKKGLVYVVLLNMLGLTFPISTVIMGQTAIASVPSASSTSISLEVPLADLDFPYQNLTPTPQILADLESAGFSLDLHVLESSSASWSRLESWLSALNESSIEYSVTLTAPSSTAVEQTAPLATTGSLLSMYANHSQSLDQLALILTTLGIDNGPNVVLFDMTLPRTEWQRLMVRTRALDLPGFSGLMRASLYSVEPRTLEPAATELAELADTYGLDSGVLVEAFVIDDVQDGDTIAMRLCGQTMNTLSLWDRIDVLCSRSRFSYEMLGDVGEYMAVSYARSISRLGEKWTIRMGEIGNVSDTSGRPNPVYGTLDSVGEDLVLVGGSGVSDITLSSLPSLLNGFGSNGTYELNDSVAGLARANATYTFRIYAFRAVFLAIDAFDFLML